MPTIDGCAGSGSYGAAFDAAIPEFNFVNVAPVFAHLQPRAKCMTEPQSSTDKIQEQLIFPSFQSAQSSRIELAEPSGNFFPHVG